MASEEDNTIPMATRFGIISLLRRMRKLVKWRRILILKFNSLRPKGDAINSRKMKPVERHEAIDYANKVKAMASHTSSLEDEAMETSDATSTNQEHLAYARSYLKAVRGVLQYYGEVTKFDELNKLLVDHGNRRFGIKRLLKGERKLLECYPVLILGFNCFLPEKYEITAKKQEPVGMFQALAFTRKVKERFLNDTERYESFVNILKRIRFDKMSLHDSFKEILDVFHDNYDLLDEFGKFLPDAKN